MVVFFIFEKNKKVDNLNLNKKNLDPQKWNQLKYANENDWNLEDVEPNSEDFTTYETFSFYE